MAIAAGYIALSRWPFPVDAPLLQVVLLHDPPLFFAIKYAYEAMWFSTPYIAFSTAASLIYIFLAGSDRAQDLVALPPYPDPARRETLYLVLGEIHHSRRPEPAANPQWLMIPERGLYTGIMILGAIGSGKTSGCMYPFAEQILSFRARDPERRIGGLVLEVKGDFCHKVRRLLENTGAGPTTWR